MNNNLNKSWTIGVESVLCHQTIKWTKFSQLSTQFSESDEEVYLNQSVKLQQRGQNEPNTN